MGAEAFLTLQIVDFAEGVDDRVAALLQAGTGITLTYNDGAGTLTIANTGLGGSTGSTDNRILRADGTGGSTVQNSAVTIDDSGNISGVARLDSTRAGSMGSTNPQNQIIIYGGFAGYGIGFDANGELTTCVNSARRSTLGTHMNLGSSGQLRFNSAADLSGSWDTLVVRNTTGPTVETRAAGGLRVRTLDGSAAGAIDCGAITASGGTVTSSTPVFSGSQTWNNGAVAFVGLSLNITSTAASASSQLLNFLVNGSSRLAADVGGHLTVQTGGIGNSNQTRVNFNGSTSQQFLVNNTTAFQIFSDSIAIGTLGTNVRIYGAFTVATLPSAAANAGALAQVTDSSVTTNGSAVSGGGANRVVVFSNGSTWDVVVA